MNDGSHRAAAVPETDRGHGRAGVTPRCHKGRREGPGPGSRFRRLPATLGLVALALALSACGGDEEGSAEAATLSEASGRQGPPPVAVAVATVETGDIARSVSVSGVVEPLRTVSVSSQLSGTLLEVPAETGDRVAQGQLLARLDAREIEAQLRAAEASLELARTAADRARRLRERQVITQAELDAEVAALAAAEAQVDQLRTRVSYATIQSPIRGTVTARTVETGDVVGNQTPLFTLADLSVLVVRVGVSELDVVNVGVGEDVSVSLDAFPDRELTGEVRRIFPAADPQTRLVPVEVALQGRALELARPGFLARATFPVGALSDVLLIPAGALTSGTGNPSVFVLQDGVARRRSVRTGLSSQGMVQVVDGLSAGETVVTRGVSNLRDGAAVRVVEES